MIGYKRFYFFPSVTEEINHHHINKAIVNTKVNEAMAIKID